MWQSVARMLGWFSIALAVAGVVAPGKVAALVGIRRRRRLAPALGVRAGGGGTGILSSRRPTSSLWARVAGDLIDLLVLTVALPSTGRRRRRALTGLAAVAGVTVLDVIAAWALGRNRRAGDVASVA